MALALLMPAGLAAQGHEAHHPDSAKAPAQMGSMGQQGMAPGGMPGGMMMEGMDMQMMMPIGPGPRMLLAQREPLALSASQTERLERLQEQMDAAATEHRAEMATLQEQMAGLREAEKLDVDEYEKLLRERSDLQVDHQVARARLGQQALDVLTDQQKSNVRYGMRMHRMMHSGAGMMGMMDGGMDQGKMMEMMQTMRRRMHESCPAMSAPENGVGN